MSVLATPRWLEQPGIPQHCTGTRGSGGAVASGATPLLPAACCPSVEVCASCKGCQPPVLLPLAPPRHAASSGEGTPAHHTVSSDAMRGAASSAPLPRSRQGSSWGSFHYCSNLTHILPAPKNSLPVPWQGFVRGSGLCLFVVKDRRWLRALLLTASLAVSWQTQGFPAQGVHQAERGAQDLHGTCRGGCWDLGFFFLLAKVRGCCCLWGQHVAAWRVRSRSRKL